MSDVSRFVLSPDSKFLRPQSDRMMSLVTALRDGYDFRLGSQDITLLDATHPPVLQCETSGSSDVPKVVERTHTSWIRSFERHQSTFELGPTDRYATLGDLGHSLTGFATVEALHLGADLIELSGLRPTVQTKALRDHKITVLYATPVQLRMLLKAGAGLRDLRLLMCGGGTMDRELWTRLAHLAPHARRVEFFGASETSFITWSDANTPAGSVGKAYPGVEIRVGDQNAAGDTGEIWVKSPYLFTRYASGEESSARWSEGYLSIGEMGYLDADGFLYLRGRVSRMITIADINVYPEEVERVLSAQTGVTTCAVVPLADKLRGHSLCAFVVGNASDAVLRKACRDALGDASVPKRIEHVDRLPLLSSGKPDLRQIANWLEPHT